MRFLQWALPRRGYRWSGFRKVRRQVCRRVRRRVRELGLGGFEAYRRHLRADPTEWRRFDGCCRITISRFYRDRRLWEVLGEEILPALYSCAAEREPPRLRIWSAGCGAGEEPFTVAMLLRLGPKPLPERIDVELLGSDLDARQLERAARAVYPESSLRDLPAEWRARAFVREADGDYRLAEPYARDVRLLHQDVRREAPTGRFDLILCRNLVFTYFDGDGQARCLDRFAAVLEAGGHLVLGGHETLPGAQAAAYGLVRLRPGLPIFRLRGTTC